MRTYVTHYFNFEYIGIYLLVSLIGLAVVIGIVLGLAKLKTRQRLQDDSLSHKAIRRINRHHQERKRSIIESFFEMVFASTSVLIFMGEKLNRTGKDTSVGSPRNQHELFGIGSSELVHTDWFDGKPKK